MDIAKKDSHHMFTPRHRMTQPAQQLNKTLASSRPEVAAHVEQSLTDVITLADTDTLDLQPSRAGVQELLTALDERLTLATALAGPANRITAILNGQRGITGDTINDKVVAQQKGWLMPPLWIPHRGRRSGGLGR